MKANSIIRTLAATLTMGPLLLAGCKKPESTVTPEVTVQAVHPQETSISEEITADATLAPLAQAAISTKITAPVKKFYVQRGSKVHEGELLATLENSDLAAAVEDNKGAYTAAQASYDTATQATIQEDDTKARLDLAQAKASLELDQSIVNSRTQLLAQGAIPGRDLDTAKAALVQAQANYDIAKQHLESVEQVSHKAALQNAAGQLSSAKGKYLGAEAQLSYTEIRSPIHGVVTDRPLFAGETAAAGAPLLTVMDTSALLAKLHISQGLAQRLTAGAPAQIAVNGEDEPIAATVSLISPALDAGSTTVEVWLRVENKDEKLRAGTAVHATITGRTLKNALTIPPDAVQIGPDGVSKSVMVISPDGTAHKRPIKLGLQNDKAVQVLDGLKLTDTVITTGAYGMDDGTKVKVGTAAADASDAKDDK